MSGKDTGKKTKGIRPKNRSSCAGLQLPVTRIHRLLKKGNYAERIGVGASVYLAAVLEYLVGEVFELAGDVARDDKKSYIMPRHLQMAMIIDEELYRWLSRIHIPQRGLVPVIQVPELHHMFNPFKA